MEKLIRTIGIIAVLISATYFVLYVIDNEVPKGNTVTNSSFVAVK